MFRRRKHAGEGVVKKDLIRSQMGVAAACLKVRVGGSGSAAIICSVACGGASVCGTLLTPALPDCLF